MYPALHPLTLMLYAAVFLATAILTARRPAYGAAALAFIVPLSLDNSVAHTSISLPKCVLLGCITGLIDRRADLLPLLRSARPLWIAFAALVVAIALSTIGAEYRGEVAREALKWIEYLLLTATVYVAYRLDPDAPLVAGALATSIVLVCASALAQEASGAPSQIAIGRGVAQRISGLLEGPNQLGAYLEAALAFAFALFAVSRRWYESMLLALIALTVPLTFSKGALAGCAIVVVTILVVMRPQLRRLVPLAAGAIAGISATALVAYQAMKHPVFGYDATALASADAVIPSVDTAGGVGHRSELWRAAWFFFRHHPLFGVGAGNYERRLPEAGLTTVRTHANNWYLQALAEGGIVLFSATVAFLVTILAQLRTALTRSPWALAAFAATLALAAHQTVDYLVFYPKVAEMWLVLVALGFASLRSP